MKQIKMNSRMMTALAATLIGLLGSVAMADDVIRRVEGTTAWNLQDSIVRAINRRAPSVYEERDSEGDLRRYIRISNVACTPNCTFNVEGASSALTVTGPAATSLRGAMRAAGAESPSDQEARAQALECEIIHQGPGQDIFECTVDTKTSNSSTVSPSSTARPGPLEPLRRIFGRARS